MRKRPSPSRRRPGCSSRRATTSCSTRRRTLSEALERLAEVLGSPEILGQIGETDRANLAKYLTISKLRLENAIIVVRSGRVLEH